MCQFLSVLTRTLLCSSFWCLVNTWSWFGVYKVGPIPYIKSTVTKKNAYLYVPSSCKFELIYVIHVIYDVGFFQK
jgi:hypothetical protein